MSFSSDIKKELCAVKDMPQDAMTAMLYGIFYSSKTEEGRPIVQTENTDLIAAVRALTEAAFPKAKHEVVRLVKKGGSLYTFRVTNGYNMIEGRFGDYSSVNTAIVSGSDNDSGAFLRGVFTACGSVTDPNKEYHLELVLPDNGRAANLRRFIAEHGIAIKQTTRSRRRGAEGSLVLYAKESELIEDFITYIGAGTHSMQIMQVKIEKDFRNRVNRSVNCENANIDKTVEAANRIIRDIEYIYQKRGADWLPEELRETARLRMEFYEMPLSELCEQFRQPISRSGLNHRLKRLSKLAQQLRDGEAK